MDAVKVIFRSFSLFFGRQCKQSFDCLFVAYSSGNVTSSELGISHQAWAVLSLGHLDFL